MCLFFYSATSLSITRSGSHLKLEKLRLSVRAGRVLFQRDHAEILPFTGIQILWDASHSG